MKHFAISLIILVRLSLVLSPLQAESRVVSGPLVVSENWPECTSLQTWMRDIMRLEKVENGSETAQANATPAPPVVTPLAGMGLYTLPELRDYIFQVDPAVW
jgi:hypothetical protein